MVDELAHTNVPGSRHARRFENVVDILGAGIHAMKAVNIQHLETLNDAVARVTGVRVRETVPDLSTSRELALRAVADEVGEKAASYRLREGLEPALIPERVMVCMSSNVAAPRVVRTGARTAGRLGAKWYAVYVETPQERPGKIRAEDYEALRENITLAESLGATVVRVKAERPAEGLVAFARREGITHVIFGQSARSRWEVMWRGSTIDKFLSAVRDAAVQVVPLEERGPEPGQSNH